MTITLISGRTKRYHIKIVDAAGTEYTPEPGDLVTLTVKKAATGEPLILKNGTEIVFDPEDTADMEPGMYIYDVVIRLVNGDLYTVIPPPPHIGAAYAGFKLQRGVYDE